MEGQIRYTDTDVADGGFQNLLFKGAPVTFDGAATSGQMMFLNTKYLQLVAHSDVWFKPTPFVRPTNQDAVFSQLLCYGTVDVQQPCTSGIHVRGYGLIDGSSPREASWHGVSHTHTRRVSAPQMNLRETSRRSTLKATPLGVAGVYIA